MPLISVIMPTYKENIEKIRASTDSILNQSISDFEFIIVVDDPNNVEAINYLRQIEKKDSRILLYINQCNKGLPITLNRALKISRGRYIARMDADDIAIYNRFEKEIEFLKNHNYDLVSCNYELFSDDKKIKKIIKNPKTFEQCKKMIKRKNCLCHPGWLGKKEVFESLGGYRNIFSCEDYDFVLRAVLLGFKIGNVQEPLLKYRINGNGISQNNIIRQLLVSDLLKSRYIKGIKISLKTINCFIESEHFKDKIMMAEKYKEDKKKIKSEKSMINKVVLLIHIFNNKMFWYERMKRLIY